MHKRSYGPRRDAGFALVELNYVTTRKVALLKQSCIVSGIKRRLEVCSDTGICESGSHDLFHLPLMNVNARPKLHNFYNIYKMLKALGLCEGVA